MSEEQDRLLVDSVTDSQITSILAACVGLAVLIVSTRDKEFSLPHKPNNILGAVALLCNSDQVLKSFRGCGPVLQRTIKNRISAFNFCSFQDNSYRSQGCSQTFKISMMPEQGIENTFSLDTPNDELKAPKILNPFICGMVYLVVVGIVESLEMISRLQTAFIISLIALYFSSVDFQTRLLTPYIKLKKGQAKENLINLDLLDLSTPRVLFAEYRSQSLAALATTTCVIISSIFTIFTGSLYSVANVPVDTSVKMQTTGSLNSTSSTENMSNSTYNVASNQFADYGTLTSSLILEGNLSYPAQTYENLAFPVYSVVAASGSFDMAASDSTNATIPALRSRLSCRRFSSADISMEAVAVDTSGVTTTHGAISNVLGITIKNKSLQSDISTTTLSPYRVADRRSRF
ncbi:hypothetical protein GGR57DRAFT_513076 [Xylariaceae sp. FL1272]|nr:hypothetical protein GGR57DRAFT_513076 [Xylariaceae sp. FL1272]